MMKVRGFHSTKSEWPMTEINIKKTMRLLTHTSSSGPQLSVSICYNDSERLNCVGKLGHCSANDFVGYQREERSTASTSAVIIIWKADQTVHVDVSLNLCLNVSQENRSLQPVAAWWCVKAPNRNRNDFKRTFRGVFRIRHAVSVTFLKCNWTSVPFNGRVVSVSQRKVLTLGGQGGLGEVEEAESFVEATNLLDQVGDSWRSRTKNREDWPCY